MGSHQDLIDRLAVNEQKRILYTIISILSKKTSTFDSSSAGVGDFTGAHAVRGISALVSVLVQGNNDLQISLVEWLVGVSAVAPAHSHIAHRAVILMIASNKGGFHADLLRSS